MIVGGDNQWVDFKHRHVFSYKGRIELLDQNARFLCKVTLEVKRFGYRAAMMRHHASRGVHREGNDLFRGRMGDFLNIHAAFGRDDKSDSSRRTVHEDGKIEFFRNIRTIFNVEAVNLLTVRARLNGNQRVAKHFLSELLHFVDGFGKAHAAFFAGSRLFEFSFAATASVNLGFNHPKRPA